MAELADVSPEDRKQVERFTNFLKYVGPVPKPGQPKRQVSDETWRYMMGDDIDPTPLPKAD